MTLSGEAKNEGGGQDIPGAFSAMGGVSMEMSQRTVSRWLSGIPESSVPLPSLSQPGLLGSECSEEAWPKPTTLRRGFGALEMGKIIATPSPYHIIPHFDLKV